MLHITSGQLNWPI